MKKLSLLILLVLFLATVLLPGCGGGNGGGREEPDFDIPGNWHPLGNGFSGVSPQLAVNDDGAPYVVYLDTKVMVRKYNNGSWDPVGETVSEGLGAYPSIAINGSSLYIAYEDAGSVPPLRATVMTSSGGSWSPVGGSTGFSANQILNNSLCYSNGKLYLAFLDRNDKDLLTVMWFNKNVWSCFGEPGFTQWYGNGCSLTVHDGIPYVAHFTLTGSDWQPVLSKYTNTQGTGGSWERVGSFNESADGSIGTVILPSGTPLIIFRDLNQGGKAVVKQYAGGSWSSVPFGENISSGTTGAIKLFAEGTAIYIAYTEYDSSKEVFNRISVKKFNRTTNQWTPVGERITTVENIDTLSLFVRNRIPYLCYKEGALIHVFKCD